MTAQRLAALVLLVGAALFVLGILAIWILVPLAGAVVTAIAGGGLVLAGYRGLAR